jgi:hypothetical protein
MSDQRLPEKDVLRLDQVVAMEYEGYLRSDGLDPAWVAGWHAAINHAVHALRKHLGGTHERTPENDYTPCPLTDMGLPHSEHWWQSRDGDGRTRLNCRGIDKFLSDRTLSSPPEEGVTDG